ncbi:MAG: Squalene synthase HpnD [Ignavibacteria bacterium]|nr:Squalene synthase HpnD [Ignavibacteria bacterium]
MEVISYTDLAAHERVEARKPERSNFYYSFSFLPREERNAINSIHAFCSYIDDIVDLDANPEDKHKQIKLDRLSWWEREIDKIYSDNVSGPLITPLVAVIKRFGIPKQYFLTLINGCRRDLIQFRYSTFEELKEYCYSVASIVGLISIEIFGYKYEETKNYATYLGYALQLTNILRDIKFDKDRGYIYLPKEDMDKFGYSEEDVIGEVYDERFVELMRFEVNRVREFYHKARTYLHPDERVTVFAAEIMDAIYYRLLEKIELEDFNVYKEKIRVANSHKFLIAIKHWLSIRMFVKRIKVRNE